MRAKLHNWLSPASRTSAVPPRGPCERASGHERGSGGGRRRLRYAVPRLVGLALRVVLLAASAGARDGAGPGSRAGPLYTDPGQNSQRSCTWWQSGHSMTCTRCRRPCAWQSCASRGPQGRRAHRPDEDLTGMARAEGYAFASEVTRKPLPSLQPSPALPVGSLPRAVGRPGTAHRHTAVPGRFTPAYPAGAAGRPTSNGTPAAAGNRQTALVRITGEDVSAILAVSAVEPAGASTDCQRPGPAEEDARWPGLVHAT